MNEETVAKRIAGDALELAQHILGQRDEARQQRDAALDQLKQDAEKWVDASRRAIGLWKEELDRVIAERDEARRTCDEWQGKYGERIGQVRTLAHKLSEARRVARRLWQQCKAADRLWVEAARDREIWPTTGGLEIALEEYEAVRLKPREEAGG